VDCGPIAAAYVARKTGHICTRSRHSDPVPLPFCNQMACCSIACIDRLRDDARRFAAVADTGSNAQVFTKLEQAEWGILPIREGSIEMTRKRSVRTSLSLGQCSTGGQSGQDGRTMWRPSSHVQGEI
jgi:hypothetical protein